MARHTEPTDGRQGRGRRKRTREDRAKRDAAFFQNKRGRPKGSVLPFHEDQDRFAVAMVYCGECFLAMPRYHAAYIALAFISGAPIASGSVNSSVARLSGGPKNATLKGAASNLIAKCDRSMTVADADWIVSSAELLGRLIQLHIDPDCIPDAVVLRRVFDDLAVRGWGPTLLNIAKKLAAVGASNLPPIAEPVSKRVQAALSHRISKPKS